MGGMILQIFSPKMAKIGIYFLKVLLVFAKNLSRNWFLRKTPIFYRKLAKIAQIIDQNIDPSPKFT
jgi:hypothetical protein